ncbi:MAG: PQQ-binding-like beta-propeller repeat protein [Gemmataceae bacterium]|nr:PQQ-like beta-propeller repeat protein [Gemmata sp.]MDW8196051.1 PQQ-binding-like beta-propeller repeat protein [Gemmataceae bacterium]
MFRQGCTFAILCSLTIALSAADWPQWRGPNRDGISHDTGLLQEWPKEGPKLRWKRTDIGPGYSSPVVVAGRVYIQTTKDKDEYALCLDEKTGQDIWKTPIGKVGPNKGPQYPGTRSTPTVDGDHLYCLASDGQLACLSTDGKVKWSRNLAKDFKGSVGNWAYTESVLVDGDAVICTPGGAEATLAALNKKTGDVIWKCAVPDGDIADYASIMIVNAGGVKQYVQFMRKGVVACDAKTGKFLWRYNGTVDFGANMLTPIVYQDKVYVSSRSGGGMVEIKADGDKVIAKQMYLEKQLTGGIGGAVLVDGYLYGGTSNALFCADFKTGKVLWTEPKAGNVSVCYADGRVYARSHNTGDVVIFEPNAKEYVEKGRLKQPDRSKTPAWPHPVVANGGLYLRDMSTLLCYDVKK